MYGFTPAQGPAHVTSDHVLCKGYAYVHWLGWNLELPLVPYDSWAPMDHAPYVAMLNTRLGTCFANPPQAIQLNNTQAPLLQSIDYLSCLCRRQVLEKGKCRY